MSAVSAANRRLLERRFSRELPKGDPKVTLTISGLCKLLDEARAEGSASRRAANLDATIERAMGVLDERFRRAGL